MGNVSQSLQATLWLVHRALLKENEPVAQLTEVIKVLGRELDEVGRVSRMADLMGPSGPDAYEAMNL